MSEHSDTPFEDIPAERIEAIKRWVEYIQTEPPEVWGPQQNVIVNAQAEAA